eukprot:4317829-Amphidinium_carterae.1
MPQLQDQTVTVWRDPSKNLTQFVIRRLAGTAVQRTHRGITSTQVRRAIIAKDWQQVTLMCGIAASAEARKMDETLVTVRQEERESDSDDAVPEAQRTRNRPSERADTRLQYPADSSHPVNMQQPVDHQRDHADVPQTQMTVDTSPGPSNLTLDIPQPASNQTTADG